MVPEHEQAGRFLCWAEGVCTAKVGNPGAPPVAEKPEECYSPRVERGNEKLLFLGVAALLLFCGSPLSAAEGGYVVGLSTYPLRETPEFSSPAVARLPVGEKVTILEEREGWTLVKAKERSGWMPDSVIGRESPPALKLGPLQERVKKMDSRLSGLVEENKSLQQENVTLSEQAGALEKELEKARSRAAGARNLQRFSGVALGGGLVIFGWITGYALAATSRRRGAKQKYRID